MGKTFLPQDAVELWLVKHRQSWAGGLVVWLGVRSCLHFLAETAGFLNVQEKKCVTPVIL